MPGLLVDEEPVHGSRAILERLEELVPDPPLYPDAIADAVREAERWGDEELQDLGRRLPWGALHFRPESMGSFGGAGPLDPAGTDYAIRYVRASWKYHDITCQQLAEDLAGLPAMLEHVDALAADGDRRRRGADRGRPADRRDAAGAAHARRPAAADRGPARRSALARRWFPDYPGDVPAGAFPAGWVPPPDGAAARPRSASRRAARTSRCAAPRARRPLPPPAARAGGRSCAAPRRISISANEAPRQRRTPPPYGIHA